jgi:hypothetical protein
MVWVECMLTVFLILFFGLPLLWLLADGIGATIDEIDMWSWNRKNPKDE